MDFFCNYCGKTHSAYSIKQTAPNSILEERYTRYVCRREGGTGVQRKKDQGCPQMELDAYEGHVATCILISCDQLEDVREKGGEKEIKMYLRK